MKRLIMILMLIMPSCMIYAQYTSNDYFGTWVYQSKDTVFTIKIQKTVLNEKELIVGGYSLKVKGVLTDNYIGNPPANWKPNTMAQNNDIYIFGKCRVDEGESLVTIAFYDQRKKHFEGKSPIGGGKMELISPTQLHWVLNEEQGIANWEGSPYGDFKPIGFSVPTDVIMTREELKPHIPKEPGVPITSPIIIKK